MEHVKQILETCVKERRQADIERDDVDDQPITAIPLKVGNQLVLIQYLYDFAMDGYKVLCLEDITAIQWGAVEEFHDRIFREEGMLDAVCVPSVSIDSWMSFFASMFEEERMLDISLERLRSEEMFFVGKVKLVEGDSLELLEIDPLGNYKSEPVKIYYKDITMVSFGNRYSDFLDKYSNEDACSR